MIKLSELQSARAAMTPGEWWTNDQDGTICSGFERSDAVHDVGQVDWAIGNTVGMIMTHNAADALIEIARAALEAKAASKGAAKARLAWSRACGVGTPRDAKLIDDVERCDKREIACRHVFEVALAKVTL